MRPNGSTILRSQAGLQVVGEGAPPLQLYWGHVTLNYLGSVPTLFGRGTLVVLVYMFWGVYRALYQVPCRASGRAHPPLCLAWTVTSI